MPVLSPVASTHPDTTAAPLQLPDHIYQLITDVGLEMIRIQTILQPKYDALCESLDTSLAHEADALSNWKIKDGYRKELLREMKDKFGEKMAQSFLPVAKSGQPAAKRRKLNAVPQQTKSEMDLFIEEQVENARKSLGEKLQAIEMDEMDGLLQEARNSRKKCVKEKAAFEARIEKEFGVKMLKALKQNRELETV
jgi:hypothetical protein